VVAESWRPLAGLAVGVAAAAWAAKIYFDRLKAFVDGAGAGNDLHVFLRASGKVLDTASPYAFHADKTFAYPPFLAWLLAPFHPLSSSAAGFLWTLLSLAMVTLALWLLDLRDWRCYALAYVFLFTRSSIDLGTIEPLLLLAVAAAWHWRERALQTAGAVAIAIVLKVFLWPLEIWLLLTRRTRAAVLADRLGALLLVAACPSGADTSAPLTPVVRPLCVPAGRGGCMACRRRTQPGPRARGDPRHPRGGRSPSRLASISQPQPAP